MIFLLIAACSQNDKQSKNSNENDDKTSEAAQGNPVTISGVLGDVQLDEPAKKVVVLEWTYAENLLAVGIQPTGVADIQGYKDWVKIDKELDGNTVDVGTRQEPSLEKIASLEPDLIIAIKFRHEAIKNELENIAPTVFFDPYPTDESFDQYTEMESTFKEIAKAVGKSEEAENVLKELDEVYADAKEKIENGDLETKDVVLTQAYSANQAPEIRLFTPNSLASVILEKIGLNNLHQSKQFEVYGYSTVNVEALTKYENANFLYVVQDNDNVFENQLKNNKVWNNLSFVKENRTYSLGGDTWLFGGPLSAKTLAEQIVDVMVTEEK
ncbi:ferrichrome ABC transporter substrate-binding protein [Pueribacillus theae]|uniref:Ferrichrome ABC transporter substrate-binding protein n=1 Tax=Pueribacillus theae TaxID=2171751 RepID=A0A2U1K4E9_9BACI|nr:ferrichrome ABC transporter substrate-binding protein [Pueribacillus theae]